MLGSDATSGNVAVFVQYMSAVPGSGETSNNNFNAKAGASDDTDTEAYSDLGGSATSSAVLFKAKYRLEGGSNNYAQQLNYQEEIVELPEGTPPSIYAVGGR
jgi:hypothetical protein